MFLRDYMIKDISRNIMVSGYQEILFNDALLEDCNILDNRPRYMPTWRGFCRKQTDKQLQLEGFC